MKQSGSDKSKPVQLWSGTISDIGASRPQYVAATGYVTALRGGDAAGPAERVAASVGAWLAQAARSELRRAQWYRQLVHELPLLHAPEGLVRRTRRALGDKLRHARLLAALAQGFRTPVAGMRVESVPCVGPLRLAIDNAQVGCARGTFAAMLGRIQGGRALDPRIARVMRAIAHESLRHAQLGWDVHEWLVSELYPAAASDQVEAALIGALHALASSEPYHFCDEPTRRILGLPAPSETIVLARQMVDSLKRRRLFA